MKHISFDIGEHEIVSQNGNSRVVRIDGHEVKQEWQNLDCGCGWVDVEMGENKPLDETEQAQLIEIMQIFMQLPNRDNLELRLFADASGSIYKHDKLDEHFHDLEEGVRLLRWYANPEQEENEYAQKVLQQIDLFLPQDTTLE